MQTHVLIIGGGLAGLALAHRLGEAGVDYRLVEARDRLGGRIHSMALLDSPGRVDLGPSWFWPGQSLIAQHLGTHGLGGFEQPSEGRLVFEARDAAIRRDLKFAPMAGALRIDGSATRLVDALAASLPEGCVLPGHAVAQLIHDGERIRAMLTTSSGEQEIEAARVMLAMPPRLVAERIRFTPDLPAAALVALRKVPTWMAGQAKLVAVYDEPFWKEAGLSGSAISQVGPLAEVHDASPRNGSMAALFGFVGVPAAMRRGAEEALGKAAIEQLERLFGPRAATPLKVFFKDWAIDEWTAVPADAAGPPEHPAGGVPAALQGLWDGRLILAGSELAPLSPGLMEGALEAADAAVDRLFGLNPVSSTFGASRTPSDSRSVD